MCDIPYGLQVSFDRHGKRQDHTKIIPRTDGAQECPIYQVHWTVTGIEDNEDSVRLQ